MPASSRVAAFVYDKLFKKTSTFAIGIIVVAIYGDRALDVITRTAWEKNNEGKLFKDVRKQLNLDAPKN